MNSSQATAKNRQAFGKIDQVYGVRTRVQPSPELQSSIILPERIVYVRGWAFGSAQTKFAFELDNELRIPCQTAPERPDIAVSLGIAEAANSGIEAFIEPTLVPRAHTLGLLAIEEQRTQLLDRITLQIGDVRPQTTLEPLTGGELSIERICVGSQVSERRARAIAASPDDLVSIEGWAANGFDLHEAIAMYAVIDDRDALPVAYGREREDVAKALGPHARYSGFRAIIDPGPYGEGTHRVRFVVLADDGKAYGCADTLALCVESRTPTV